MYQGTKNSFALPVELTAKFFGLQYRNRTDDIKITFIVAASALYSIKICLATSSASYFRGFAQTHINHQEHSLSGRDYMLRFQRSAMFVIASCREASVINNRLLARNTGIEPVPPRS